MKMASKLITGVICAVRVEDVQEPTLLEGKPEG